MEQDGRLRVTAWVRPDQMYATLSALQSTASDPAPDLRERIISAVMDASSKDIEWEYSEDAEQFAQRIADAVLSTLGEPK